MGFMGESSLSEDESSFDASFFVMTSFLGGSSSSEDSFLGAAFFATTGFFGTTVFLGGSSSSEESFIGAAF